MASLTYSFDEIMSDSPVEEPLIAGGVRCHGGYVNGEYVPPRSAMRRPAIEAWRQRLSDDGHPLIHVPEKYVPPNYPNYCATWIEITGTDGSLFLDDTQRDNWLNTEKRGQEFPMSTMPGEWVNDVFAGGMGPETIHFLEACIRDTPVMVTPESARRVMETYSAADLSADRNEPVDLPLTNETISGIAELKERNRAGINPAGATS